MKQMIHGKNPFNQGFTIVEMIVAILLVGIVAVTMFSRFTSPGSFNVSIARDNVIAMALQAQQASLGRDNVSFEIDPQGGDWRFQVAVSGTVLRAVTVPGLNVAMETGVSGTCAMAMLDPVSNNFRVTYDGQGNISGFTNSLSAPEPVTNGVRICINDTTDYSACLSPAGFAYQGDCDE